MIKAGLAMKIYFMRAKHEETIVTDKIAYRYAENY